MATFQTRRVRTTMTTTRITRKTVTAVAASSPILLATALLFAGVGFVGLTMSATVYG